MAEQEKPKKNNLAKIEEEEEESSKNHSIIITTKKLMKMNLSKLEAAEKEMKMAALAIHLKARLRSVDMPFTMQERALCFTKSFLDVRNTSRRLNPSQLAYALKKEFDTRYGAVWHCIVGKSYGSYVTHSPGGFLYFSFDSHFVLLFKTQVHVLSPTLLPQPS